MCSYLHRAVARSENPGGLVILGGENVPPLVEIGLTDLPKTGLATGLRLFKNPKMLNYLYGLLICWYNSVRVNF